VTGVVQLIQDDWRRQVTPGFTFGPFG